MSQDTGDFRELAPGEKPGPNDVELDVLFTYHPPTPDQIARYNKLRLAARDFAVVILEETPKSADQSAAIRKVREAVMTANAAIACHRK